MKRIVFIFALCLIFQIAFAQKQDSKFTTSPEVSFQTSLNTSINELELAFKFVKTDGICLKTHIGKQIFISQAVDIARNSGGKHGEGRLPNAYSESLSKPILPEPTAGIDRNSNGKQGEGIFPGAYSKNLSKSCTDVIVDDIARNSGGRNSN
ncbi:hypothetical protein [Ancylomarina sp.]|uniref:hypothetical protein n=1 Tax=Ancylomarina sp. TaxID=1970196 RepID=UPI0035630C65